MNRAVRRPKVMRRSLHRRRGAVVTGAAAFGRVLFCRSAASDAAVHDDPAARKPDKPDFRLRRQLQLIEQARHTT
ncbi:hypothetical protein NTJ56_34370 [Burkholderia contaminans]|uniref:hypothetical protein n=1 Tax=Burkholderia contaminans TaxID=488447 RepID=UPI001CF17D52|nr:hypothetical protein [Burkholderia contaminans]MCA7917563.1 hypothetical protein [Burkholderia contaminans]UUX42709.1 hypothetical protein NTJ56_34370 [Burkholderia contaminans]